MIHSILLLLDLNLFGCTDNEIYWLRQKWHPTRLDSLYHIFIFFCLITEFVHSPVSFFLHWLLIINCMSWVSIDLDILDYVHDSNTYIGNHLISYGMISVVLVSGWFYHGNPRKVNWKILNTHTHMPRLVGVNSSLLGLFLLKGEVSASTHC